MGKCECGCGGETNLAKYTQASSGKVKGQPSRFIRGHSSRGRSGPLNGKWIGGRSKATNGYMRVIAPGHPKNNGGYMLEHILIAEKALGRPLPKGAEVHHVNEIKTDNRNENLVICENHAYHFLLHARMKERAEANG